MFPLGCFWLHCSETLHSTFHYFIHIAMFRRFRIKRIDPSKWPYYTFNFRRHVLVPYCWNGCIYHLLSDILISKMFASLFIGSCKLENVSKLLTQIITWRVQHNCLFTEILLLSEGEHAPETMPFSKKEWKNVC